jgi:hypothetical protein
MSTPRLQLPYPAPGDPADVPADIQGLAAAVDAAAIGYAGQGTFANRPAPGIAGRIYHVVGDPAPAWSDTTWYDNGGTWIPIGRSSPATINSQQSQLPPSGEGGENTAGRTFWAWDTARFFVDDGVKWNLVGAAGGQASATVAANTPIQIAHGLPKTPVFCAGTPIAWQGYFYAQAADATYINLCPSIALTDQYFYWMAF